MCPLLAWDAGQMAPVTPPPPNGVTTGPSQISEPGRLDTTLRHCCPFSPMAPCNNIRCFHNTQNNITHIIHNLLRYQTPTLCSSFSWSWSCRSSWSWSCRSPFLSPSCGLLRSSSPSLSRGGRGRGR